MNRLDQLQNIPNEMKELQQWIVNNEERIPLQKWGSKENWLTFEKAIALKQEKQGLGFVVTEEDPYVMIDIDHCVQNGRPLPWAKEIIDAFDTYTEISASGKGLHLIAKVTNKNGFKSINKPAIDVEIYPSKKVMTLTGDVYNEQIIKERTEQIKKLYQKVEEYNEIVKSIQAPKFKKLWKGNFEDYPSQSEADFALASYLLKATNNNTELTTRLISISGLGRREKWFNQPDYRYRTIKNASKDFSSTKIEPNGRKLTRRYRKSRSVTEKEDIAKAIKDETIAITNKISAMFHIKTILESEPRPMIYYWDNGVYRPNAEGLIKQLIRDEFGVNTHNHEIKEIIGHLKGITYVSENVFDTEPERISLKNGIINITTGEFEDNTPEFLTLVQLPVEYDPNAECPRWEQFLQEVMIPRGEELTLENSAKINTLQEFAGYCLYRACPFDKAVMLAGEGSNGKSVFLDLLTELLGRSNVSNIPIQSFESREYALSSMLGKLANIHADLSDKSLRDSGLFKQVVSGEQLHINIKYKNPINSVIYAKQLYSANKVPKTSDYTRAFFRRWLIFDFPNRFEGNEKDTKLKQKLKEELPGIFNWAMAGLKRLLENQCFSWEPSVEEMELTYQLMSDPVASFVNECLEQDSEAVVTKEEMYNAFLSYAKSRRMTIVSNSVFAKELPHSATGITQTRPKIGKERVQCWSGWKYTEEKPVKGVKGVRGISSMLADYAHAHAEQQREKSLDIPDTPDQLITEEIDMTGEADG